MLGQKRVTVPKLVKRTGLSEDSSFYKNETNQKNGPNDDRTAVGMIDPKRYIRDIIDENRINYWSNRSGIKRKRTMEKENVRLRSVE